jgi:DNA-binding response OmpR family regulator
VADDDDELRTVVIASLREDGYELVEETDGGRLLVRVAGQYAQAGKVDAIDLIISDVQMPVCTGIDILKGLRDARWATPVILMTSFVTDEVRRRASSLRAILLQKPFELSELRAIVRQLLEVKARTA